MSQRKSTQEVVCCFCQRPPKDPREKFFAGPRVGMMLDKKSASSASICPECTALAYSQSCSRAAPCAIMSAQRQTPEWIESRLSEVVIGQAEVKQTLAIAAWQHIHRRSLPEEVRDVVPKHNVLIAGPTGTGKTLMLETLAKIIDVPMITFDASTVTEAGYIGAKVEQCVHQLIAVAGSLECAEFGIIHLDEIDKIRRRSGVQSDVGGESTQQAFLKILEGMVVSFEKKSLSTRNILFVATGAFPDLYEKHVANTQGSNMGFTAPRTSAPPLMSISTEQFAHFGMIPEFMRRFPSIALMQPLAVSDLENIIRMSSHSPTEQYSRLLATMGVETVWQDDFIQEVARRAYAKRIGASGIASVLEHSFRKLLFLLPGIMNNYGQGLLTLTFTSESLDSGVPEHKFEELAVSATR